MMKKNFEYTMYYTTSSQKSTWNFTVHMTHISMLKKFFEYTMYYTTYLKKV